MTDPADRGADNGIRLIAGKPAWARVYLWEPFGASGVAGTLEVQRRSNGFLWNTATTVSPDPSSATSVPPALGLDAFVALDAGERTVSLRLGARGRPTSVTVDSGGLAP